jgi:feruloyl-CoA synthase
MSALAASWSPDPFATQFERRADGSMILRPLGELDALPATLIESLARWANLAPERVLVARRKDGGAWREITYAQMFARVRRLAVGLSTRNLSADKPLVILSGNSIEHLTLAFAAMWAGIPYCPVSPAYSLVAGELATLRHALDLLTPGMVAAFDTQKFARALARVDPAVEIVGDAAIDGRTVNELDSLEGPFAEPPGGDRPVSTPDSIVRFLLTSGSTGKPKAVITTNRMCCSNAAMLRQSMPFLATEAPVLLDWLPWNHTFGGSHNLGLVLTYGGSLYIDDGRPTPSAFAETLRNLREISPTVYFNVPKGFDMLAPHLQNDRSLRESFYRRLRACFFAGASLSQHTWDQLDAAALGELKARIPMLSGLGATETGPSVTFTTPQTERSGVVGLPAAGAVVKLAPVADKLEIRVRGPAVTPGYWRQPELTRNAFDEEGFYRLGDAVRPIDPADPRKGLKFDGRIGEDFKLANGTWVSVGPLRTELIAALAPIAQDVVIAGLDAEFVAAIVVPDLAACATLLSLAAPPSFEAAAADARLIGLVRERLAKHARENPASTRSIRRAALLPVAPSLDRGEITDKGSLNQRAILAAHTALVSELYSPSPAGFVAVVEPGK